MTEPSLEDYSDGPPAFPTQRIVNNGNYLLSEIKRILYWANHETIKKRDENAYVVTTNGAVSGGGASSLHLKNPEGSGVTFDVEEITVSTQFKGDFRIYDGFDSAPSGGTGVTPENLLLDSEGVKDTGNGVASSDPTFTENNRHYIGVIPSGGQGGASTGGKSSANKPMIEPGREIVVEVSNDTTESADASISIVYHEETYIYS